MKIFRVLCLWSCGAFCCAVSALYEQDKWGFVSRVLEASSVRDLASMAQEFFDDVCLGDSANFCVQEWKAVAQETLDGMQLGKQGQAFQKDVDLAMDILWQEEMASQYLKENRIFIPKDLRTSDADSLSATNVTLCDVLLGTLCDHSGVQDWVRQSLYSYNKSDNVSVMTRFAVMQDILGSPEKLSRCVYAVLEEEENRKLARVALYEFLEKNLHCGNAPERVCSMMERLFLWGARSWFNKVNGIKLSGYCEDLTFAREEGDVVGCQFLAVTRVT